VTRIKKRKNVFTSMLWSAGLPPWWPHTTTNVLGFSDLPLHTCFNDL